MTEPALILPSPRRPRRKAATEDEILEAAAHILQKRMIRSRQPVKDPTTTKQMLTTWIGTSEHEKFCGVFLDNQHRVIAFEVLSNGTIDGASVYPREVIKAALKHNAAAVIFAHNHPSGVAEPSAADRALTERLRGALAQVDIRTLDHFVVGTSVVSFAERGWI